MCHVLFAVSDPEQLFGSKANTGTCTTTSCANAGGPTQARPCAACPAGVLQVSFCIWLLVMTKHKMQVGGMMRSEEMFKRAVVRYSINGSIESITEEVRHRSWPRSRKDATRAVTTSLTSDRTVGGFFSLLPVPTAFCIYPVTLCRCIGQNPKKTQLWTPRRLPTRSGRALQRATRPRSAAGAQPVPCAFVSFSPSLLAVRSSISGCFALVRCVVFIICLALVARHGRLITDGSSE